MHKTVLTRCLSAIGAATLICLAMGANAQDAKPTAPPRAATTTAAAAPSETAPVPRGADTDYIVSPAELVMPPSMVRSSATPSAFVMPGEGAGSSASPPGGVTPVAADAIPSSMAAESSPATAAPIAAPKGKTKGKAFTGIQGVVSDAKTGEPLIEATVKVIKGGKGSAQTGVDGKYKLKLPPGDYDLRVFYEMYKGRQIKGVNVGKGAPVVVDVQLEADSSAVQEVVVEAKADKRTEAAILQERRKAPVVADTISAQEMARTPDNSASDAVKRVVSVTVVNDRYVVLRGLGGRYSQTLLNNVFLPSPEPDEPQTPLDLFPTNLLSNMQVAKTYAADLPGTFGGGTLLIETNTYPSDFELKLKLSVSGDEQTTFRGDKKSYEGGSLDWLGWDDGGRGLPDAVPGDRPVDSEKLDPAEQEKIGESFRRTWSARDTTGMPNLSFNATAGDTIPLGGVKLGYIGSLTFNRREENQRSYIAIAKIDGEGDQAQVKLRESATSKRGTDNTTVSGLANVGLQFNQNHDVNALLLYTHNGENQAEFIRGYNETDSQDFESTRLRFISRELTFSQLAGFHRFTPAGRLELRWQANLALTGRGEPDTRDIAHNVVPDLENNTESLRFKTGQGSAERFFSRLRDTTAGGGLGFTLPVDKLQIKWGGALQNSSRDFAARRFRYDILARRTDPAVLFLKPEEMLSNENIGPNFVLEERTLPEDAYKAGLLVAAGYAAVDINYLDPVRLIPGVRYEYANQTLNPGSPFATSATPPTGVDRTDSDLLPAMNAVWAIRDDLNLRAAYSYTLVRPQFRELAPFLYFDFTRRRQTSGNPNLDRSRIHNGDLRLEWFPSGKEVLAASGFIKRFEKPIERTVVGANGDVSFANAEGALAGGGEIEGRLSLSRITPALEGLRLGANVAWIHSSVDLTRQQAAISTSRERPLQGQSPYVINGGLTYDLESIGLSTALLYNVSGARIADVGFDKLPDIYEQPIHRLDATVSKTLPAGFRVKFAAANILNEDFVLTQGDLVVQQYLPGVNLSLSLEWSPQQP
ncbi:MAG: hypothetical protein GMKNLPBB_00756 [Myxococcota bacterium]|nr:hypothetical protein [Myxococcota bacterium]